MIQNALNGEAGGAPVALAQLAVDFNVEPWVSARRAGDQAVQRVLAPDVAGADWDTLLCAVKTRLRLSVESPMTQHMNGAAAPLRACVLECVDALDQLHASLRHVLPPSRPAEWHDSEPPAA